jgi:hypothetical protein
LSRDAGARERGDRELSEKGGSLRPHGVGGPKTIAREHSPPSRHAKDWFGSGYCWRPPGGVRNLRGPGRGRRRGGFLLVARWGFGRTGRAPTRMRLSLGRTSSDPARHRGSILWPPARSTPFLPSPIPSTAPPSSPPKKQIPCSQAAAKRNTPRGTRRYPATDPCRKCQFNPTAPSQSPCRASLRCMVMAGFCPL